MNAEEAGYILAANCLISWMERWKKLAQKIKMVTLSFFFPLFFKIDIQCLCFLKKSSKMRPVVFRELLE